MKTNFLIFSIALMTLISCRSELTDTLSEAGENRSEILAVIDHYSGGEPLKFESARFLIMNLSDHKSIRSVALDSMIDILSSDSISLSDSQKESLWEKLCRNDKIEKKYDAHYMKSEDLISNIDQAFETWTTSPWKEKVSFQIFCDYILPHRILNEPFVSGWREKLREKYHHIIKDETDVIKAYEKIHCEVMKRFRNHPLGIPHIAPLKEIERFGTGSCIQGCLYETAVMRSLGIPTAIDAVTVWSNYSRNGHAWCALVLDDATYTMTKHDTVASKFNVIDSSTFPPCYDIEADYPYKPTFKKRAAKIQRIHYSSSQVEYSDSFAPDSIREIFANQHSKDVSDEYFNGFTLSLRSEYIGYIYLCTWRTGYGWYPVDFAHNADKIFHFDNLGDSTLYLPVIYRNGKPRSLMNPILIEGGHPRVLNPDNEMQKISVDRKYPLVGKFIDRWCAMRGGRFEVLNDLSSKSGTTVAIIDRTPVFRNEIKIEKPVKGKHIRYISPTNINYPITEIEFYSHDSILCGQPESGGISSPEKAFDKDTYKTLDNALGGYYVGLSFNSDEIVDRIVFYPQNDGNFVLPGQDYELLYFDREWKSIEKKTSQDYYLDFIAPKGALLMLRTSKGNETRPFIYVKDYQKWL